MTDARHRGTVVETTSPSARITQGVLGVVLTVLSVLLMLTTHRMRLALGGVDLPVGLIFGGAFQIVTCVFLYAATGSRLPLIVVGALWGLAALPFLGHGAGGGVLMPAEIAGRLQLAGWIVQGLGIGIPFLAALLITVGRAWRQRRR
ncbi:hypothetical protein [Brachybacterium fresconis]|uniref:Membrane protein YGL010W n=1 Tax=Brachybacterium fresconis TaxID=173363 RepID=A0ABS4YPW3_9MICO|nr:putative membrane protein YGL010W [Brachybacterium fresconis]